MRLRGKLVSSALEWHEHQLLGGSLMWAAFTQRGRYDITDSSQGDPRNPRWYTTRMDHPLMPKFDGFCPTLDAAKRACETDYIALIRADRWLDFMRDNDPPGATAESSSE